MATNRENQLISTLVSGVQNTPEFSSLDPSTRLILNQTIQSYINQNSAGLLREVDEESNLQLNTIPNNTIGINNPLNIVSQNTSATNVKNTLNPIVTQNVSNNVTIRLADELFNAFSSKLPPIVRSTLNTGILRSGLTSSLSTSVPTAIENSVTSFSDNLMSGKVSYGTTIPNIGGLFGANPTTALETVNQNFATSLSNEALREAQSFNVNNLSNTEKLVVQSTGFLDPAAQYPTKEYAGRTEVNKLATGDVAGTIVQTKELERRKGIQLPNGTIFEQPPIPFKGEYPYNKVTQTESGHIIELDDTPGAERIQVYHRSGTFVEIDTNGTVVKRTKGSSYEIIDKNGYISVNGDASVSVKGSVKVYIGGDADIEVEGDVNLNCFNDITMQAAGRIDMSATEEINLHSANINIEADVDLNVKSDRDSYYTAGGSMHHKSNGIMYSQTLSNYNVLAGGSILNESQDQIHNLAAGSIFNQSGSQIHFKASSTINADGSQIYWNSGTSSAARSSLAATYSNSANIGLIGARKDVIYTTIPDPVSPTYLDLYGLAAEDSEFAAEGAEQERLLKQLGIASSDDFNQLQIPIGTENPATNNTTVVRPSNFVLSQTYLPDNFQLSKHFTLAQVSSKAVVSNYTVQSQLGLTYGEIVYNLQAVALNILEPVLALYPNMFVTSGFRTAASSSATSDHPRGKAVDLQFRGASRTEYFEIAKRLAETLNYDKMLLEYKTYGTGMPWIHISFDVNQQKRQVLTYFNDRKYGTGLTNFA